MCTDVVLIIQCCYTGRYYTGCYFLICQQTEGQTNMAKLTVTFRSFANASENGTKIISAFE